MDKDTQPHGAEGQARAGSSSAALARRLVLLIALASVVLAGLAARDESLTWDEPIFIISGLSYWQTGDHRLNSEAPPFAQQLLALPLLWLDLPRPPYDGPGFLAANQVGFAVDYLAAHPAELQKITQWARAPVWFASALCVYLAGAWALALFGPLGALTAALGVALSPTLMAHSRLATTDYLCSTAMLAASYLLWRALGSGRWHHWLLYGAAVAVAVMAKFTALLLGPLAVVQVLYVMVRDRRAVAPLALRAAAALAVFVLLVSAAYGRLLDIRPFLAGLSHLYVNTNPDYHTYVLGAVLERSVWYYYLVAFLLKTPLPALLLLGAALLGVARHPRGAELAVFLLLPAGLMIGVSCFDTINVGIRRIMPALPMLAIFSALVASAAHGRRSRLLIGAALLWMVIETAVYYPHQLPYFNTLAGGPGNAPYLLDDSNIDWGQELPALARWQAQHAPAEKMYLSYFGTIAPALYGVRATPMTESEYRAPPPGLYALSTHRLVWLRKVDYFTHAGLDWLTRYQPIDRIGYSIYLYRFPAAAGAH
jgi:hypothetical protein